MTDWRYRVACWLRRMARWVEGSQDALWADTAALVAEADRLFKRSRADGEYRRHWVYAALIKRHPAAPKRQLALTIERVISE